MIIYQIPDLIIKQLKKEEKKKSKLEDKLAMIRLSSLEADLEIIDSFRDFENRLILRRVFIQKENELIEENKKIALEVVNKYEEKTLFLSSNYGLILHSNLKAIEDFFKKSSNQFQINIVKFGVLLDARIKTKINNEEITFIVRNSYNRASSFSLVPSLQVSQKLEIPIENFKVRRNHLGDSETLENLIKLTIKDCLEIAKMKPLLINQLKREVSVDTVRSEFERYKFPKYFNDILKEKKRISRLELLEKMVEKAHRAKAGKGSKTLIERIERYSSSCLNKTNIKRRKRRI